MKIRQLLEGIEPKLPGAFGGVQIMTPEQFLAKSAEGEIPSGFNPDDPRNQVYGHVAGKYRPIRFNQKLEEEDEEVEDEIGFKDRDYDKNSTEYDPFDKLSGQIKNQIATTLFEKEDKFGNMSMGQKYKLYIKLFNLSNIE